MKELHHFFGRIISNIEYNGDSIDIAFTDGDRLRIEGRFHPVDEEVELVLFSYEMTEVNVRDPNKLRTRQR